MSIPSAPPLTNIDMQTEKITMFFSANNLPSKKGTTDAFASIHIKNNKTGALDLLKHTEAVMDTNHPTWMTHCIVDYQFQDIQEIVVRIYHKKNGIPITTPSAHEFLGEAMYHQSALMMSPGSKISLPLSTNSGIVRGASLVVRGEAVACTRDIFCCGFQCNNLVRKNGMGIFGRSDPYIKISRKFEDNTYSVVWQSKHIVGDLNPLFAHNRISMLPLCNGDVNRELSIDLFDYDEKGNHKPMGGFRTTVLQLLESNGKSFTLIEQARVGSFMYSNSGTFRCVNAHIETHPTLGQYIMGGLEISLTVAIDFTASNGCSRDGRPDNGRKSLHRIGDPGTLNNYEKAILGVGSVIEPYSNSKQFGVYGFGAKIFQPDQTLSPVQHCFPIYGGESIVQGTNGIIQAYHDCLSVVSMSGPTFFRPLIDCGGYLASERGCTQEAQTYSILMILTDGIIDDQKETIQSIIRASNTPLSILIIGIGDADFSEMSALDADDKILEQGGAKAARDIVQFVPFKKFIQQGPVALAQSVLAEIPDQIIKYMEINKIVPNAPPPPPSGLDEAPPPAFDEAPPPF